MAQIQIDGLYHNGDSCILSVTRIDPDNTEKPYTQFSFDGGPELEDFYNKHCARNLTCSLKNLEEASVLVEKGLSPVEVLSKFIV